MWVEDLVETINLARSYCAFGKLRDTLALIDPDAAVAAVSKPGEKGERVLERWFNELRRRGLVLA